MKKLLVALTAALGVALAAHANAADKVEGVLRLCRRTQ